MLFAEEGNEHDGDHVWVLKTELPHIEDAPEVATFAAEFYGVDIEEAKELINPDRIVGSAGAWDDPDFVSELWQIMEPIGFRTADGAVVLDRHSVDLEYYEENPKSSDLALLEAKAAWELEHPRSERTWEYGLDDPPPPLDELGPTECPFCGLEWLDDDCGIGYPPFGVSIHDMDVDREPWIEWQPCCEGAREEVSDLVGVEESGSGFREFYGVTIEDALSYLTGEDVVEVSDALDWSVSRRLTIYDPAEKSEQLDVEVKLWDDGPASDAFFLPAWTASRSGDDVGQLAEWQVGSIVDVDTEQGWFTVRVLQGAHYAADNPVGWRDAAFDLVRQHHRRLPEVHGYKYAIACMNGPVDTGKAVGIAIVSRPVARATQEAQPGTLEVTRVATWGKLKKNASSKLYAACAERARDLGYDRLITATHRDESGHSLLAAGWQVIGIRYRVDARGWGAGARERRAPVDPVGKTRWALGLTKTQKRAVRREAETFAREDAERRRRRFAADPRLEALRHWARDEDRWAPPQRLSAHRVLASYLRDQADRELALWTAVSETGASREDLEYLADWQRVSHRESWEQPFGDDELDAAWLAEHRPDLPWWSLPRGDQPEPAQLALRWDAE